MRIERITKKAMEIH